MHCTHTYMYYVLYTINLANAAGDTKCTVFNCTVYLYPPFANITSEKDDLAVPLYQLRWNFL